MWAVSSKDPGSIEYLISFPPRRLARVVTGHCRRNSAHPRDFTGKGLLEACAWVLQTSPYVPFPYAGFALYPFAVINWTEC